MLSAEYQHYLNLPYFHSMCINLFFRSFVSFPKGSIGKNCFPETIILKFCLQTANICWMAHFYKNGVLSCNKSWPSFCWCHCRFRLSQFISFLHFFFLLVWLHSLPLVLYIAYILNLMSLRTKSLIPQPTRLYKALHKKATLSCCCQNTTDIDVVFFS